MTTVPPDRMKAGHLPAFGKIMSAPLASGPPDRHLPQKLGKKNDLKKEKEILPDVLSNIKYNRNI